MSIPYPKTKVLINGQEYQTQQQADGAWVSQHLNPDTEPYLLLVNSEGKWQIYMPLDLPEHVTQNNKINMMKARIFYERGQIFEINGEKWYVTEPLIGYFVDNTYVVWNNIVYAPYPEDLSIKPVATVPMQPMFQDLFLDQLDLEGLVNWCRAHPSIGCQLKVLRKVGINNPLSEKPENFGDEQWLDELIKIEAHENPKDIIDRILGLQNNGSKRKIDMLKWLVKKLTPEEKQKLIHMPYYSNLIHNLFDLKNRDFLDFLNVEGLLPVKFNLQQFVEEYQMAPNPEKKKEILDLLRSLRSNVQAAPFVFSFDVRHPKTWKPLGELDDDILNVLSEMKVFDSMANAYVLERQYKFLEENHRIREYKRVYQDVHYGVYNRFDPDWVGL